MGEGRDVCHVHPIMLPVPGPRYLLSYLEGSGVGAGICRWRKSWFEGGTGGPASNTKYGVHLRVHFLCHPPMCYQHAINMKAL